MVSLGGRHHRICPSTPKHNGKVERYNRLMADEVLYARACTSETQRRDALQVWVNHYNYQSVSYLLPRRSAGLAGPGPRQQRHALLHLG